MSEAKNAYRSLCLIEKSIPIFSQAWWLDATAGSDNWDVVIAARGGKILASMPFTLSERCGFVFMGQPKLTQTLGPWISATNSKHSTNLSLQKDLMNELIEKLPPFHNFSQNWNYQQKNWLPFFWKGFKQTTRYTYVLSNLHDEKDIWDSLQSNIRTDIKKARDKLSVRVRQDVEIDEFLRLNKLVFDRQGTRVPYSEEYVRTLDRACREKNARQIFVAEDPDGRRHAGVYLVWDQNSAYYLMGGGDPSLRGSGATSLCMWEAIKFASTRTEKFDFEGSMLEPVERFFRAFGGIQTPYFSLSKTPAFLLRVAFFLRDLKARG